MDVYKVTLYLVLLVLSTTIIRGAGQNVSNHMIEARLEYLQWRMMEMDTTIKKFQEIINYQWFPIPRAGILQNRTVVPNLVEVETQSNTIIQEDLTSNHQNQTHKETVSNGIIAAISQLNDTIVQNFISWRNQSFVVLKEYQESNEQKWSKVVGAMEKLSELLLHHITTLQSNETVKDKHEQMRMKIQKLATRADLDLFLFKSGLDLGGISSQSCKKEPSKQSGKYILKANEYDAPFLGYCEHATLGGDWLVIQFRYDGSVDFFRNWTQYRDGFGSLDGEFWLGLEHVHRLTTARPHELLVELKDYHGNYSFARYHRFEVGCEVDQYVLAKLGSCTGSAKNSLIINKHEKFTTHDRDNDGLSGGNCAADYKGAWWYSMCGISNLNGMYMNSQQKVSMHWWGHNNSQLSIAYSRMMIREI